MTGCPHVEIVSWTDGPPKIWACAACSRRFYPACEVCVSVGHRNEHAPVPTPPDALDLGPLVDDGCPACHHPDHDPGSCEWCPRCELHTDDALAWVQRLDPESLAPTPPDAPLREAAQAVMDYLEAEGAEYVVPEGRIAALRAALTPKDPDR